ncbi:MAG: hypothetical protein ACI4R8_01960 [Candidatus Caccovivens sp.]
MEEIKDQNVQFENEPNDDDLYAKLQTEKLLKRKKQNRIATLCGMCFAFALAVVIIVLAAVPVSLKPRCAGSGFYDVTLYPGTVNPDVTYAQGDEGYDNFMKAYDNSFSQSYISAIFSGSLGSYSIVETKQNASDVVGTTGGLLVANKQYYVRLRYNEEQTLVTQNGKTYVSTSSSSAWNGQLTFKEVYVVVNQTEGIQETKIYVVTAYPKFDDNGQITDQKGDPKVVTISVKANTYEIYKAWNDLTK